MFCRLPKQVVGGRHYRQACVTQALPLCYARYGQRPSVQSLAVSPRSRPPSSTSSTSPLMPTAAPSPSNILRPPKRKRTEKLKDPSFKGLRTTVTSSLSTSPPNGSLCQRCKSLKLAIRAKHVHPERWKVLAEVGPHPLNGLKPLCWLCCFFSAIARNIFGGDGSVTGYYLVAASAQVALFSPVSRSRKRLRSVHAEIPWSTAFALIPAVRNGRSKAKPFEPQRISSQIDERGIFMKTSSEQSDSESGVALGCRTVQANADYDLVRQWLDYCESEHGALCRSKPSKKFVVSG